MSNLHFAQKFVFATSIWAAFLCTYTGAGAATAAMSGGPANVAVSPALVNTGASVNGGAAANTNRNIPPNTTSVPAPNATNGGVGIMPSPNTGKGTTPNPASLTTSAQIRNNNVPPSNWNAENQFWQSNFSSRPYSINNQYATYQPAFEYGVATYNQHSGQPFSSVDEAQMRTNWEQTHPNSGLSWDQAKPAIQDAYDRLYSVRNNNFNEQ